MSLSVEKLPNVGVEVKGFDIGKPADAATVAELKALWYEHAILLFRDQDMDDAKQIEFSRLFGPLEAHPLKTTRHEKNPELFVLEAGTDKDGFHLGYFDGEPRVAKLSWHMDLHYTAKPNHGAVLRAVTVAPELGGTGFGDLAAAYDALDDDLKARIADLEVAYRFNMQQKKMRFVDTSAYEPGPQTPKKPSDMGFPDFPDAIYPAVVTHPISGRKVLEIVEQFLDRVVEPGRAGMSEAEADDLLWKLVAHIKKPEFHYWHDWKEGDMVLWDNWRAMHSTTGTRPGHKRRIHRTTIMGDVMLGRCDAPAAGEKQFVN